MDQGPEILVRTWEPVLKRLTRPLHCRGFRLGSARQVSLLQRDFEVNLDAAALMADLMQEVRALKMQLRGFLFNRFTGNKQIAHR